MSTTTHPAVSEYLARTEAALADLPTSEIAEIVEDIGPHLSEIAAEVGEGVTVDALTDRLGTPEQYASELRAAAGYPPADPARPGVRPGQGPARFALWSLVLAALLALIAGLIFPILDEDVIGAGLLVNVPLYVALVMIFTGRVTPAAVAALPEYHAAAAAGRRAMAALPGNVASYLRSLRPAWWLVRIVALIAALLFPLNGKAPQVMSAVVALIILLLLGGRARRDPRWNWVVVPANFFAAGLVVALAGVASEGLAGPRYYPVGVGYQSGLYQDGRPVDNVYVFGPDGKPLSEAYLYDQDGRPVTVPGAWCDSTHSYEPTNKVPQPRLEFDQGRCREVHGVPFTVAIPTSSPQPTTTTAPPTTTGK